MRILSFAELSQQSLRLAFFYVLLIFLSFSLLCFSFSFSSKKLLCIFGCCFKSFYFFCTRFPGVGGLSRVDMLQKPGFGLIFCFSPFKKNSPLKFGVMGIKCLSLPSVRQRMGSFPAFSLSGLSLSFLQRVLRGFRKEMLKKLPLKFGGLK